MRTLIEIIHSPSVNLAGLAITRTAVRAIIVRDRTLLMIYSQKNGDYKFPGGGTEDGESHADALKRELREECGLTTAAILQPFGKTIEYSISIEPEYDVFRMTSYYYLCEAGGELVDLTLDAYEQELGFVPVWIDIDAAILQNTKLVRDRRKKAPRWTAREVAVLERIRVELITSG